LQCISEKLTTIPAYRAWTPRATFSALFRPARFVGNPLAEPRGIGQHRPGDGTFTHVIWQVEMRANPASESRDFDLEAGFLASIAPPARAWHARCRPRGGRSLAQIAGPTLHPPLLNASAKGFGNFVGAFDQHALCLTPDSRGPGPATPADGAPKADHGSAACCFWHGSAGFAPPPAATIKRVAFWSFRIPFVASAKNVSTRLSGTFRARGPPLGA
jgi:hypothetical protein